MLYFRGFLFSRSEILFGFTDLRQHCTKLLIFRTFFVEIIVENLVSGTMLLDISSGL